MAAPGTRAASAAEITPDTVLGTAAAAPAAANPIVAENQQPGTSGWLSQGPKGDDATGQIKGYWSATSVKQNENITLFVSVNPVQTYTVDIYRMGWYQGWGGRLRLHLGPLDGVTQARCVPDPTTGLIACGWTPSYTLTVPGDWVSGVYLGLLRNAAGFENYTVFVVRDDRPAAFLYQQNVMTDQAYNNYPNDGVTGKSLYTYNSYGPNTVAGDARAVKVSFDRPYSDHGTSQFDPIEFIRWVERSGYDITYSTDVDTHANGASLRDHKAVLVVGHDEYWSKEMFDALEGARDAGVGLAFFAADTGSVQVRFEPSVSGVPDRVMVCYKSAAVDPISGPTTTVAFRQPPVNRAEQSLRGVIGGSMLQGQDNFDYVVTHSSHWIYAGTGFTDGDVVPGIVGYEMDRFRSEFAVPNSTNWTLLSSSPFVDYVGVDEIANSSIYQAPSGAWVFSSGTISWTWALDGFWHQRADTRIQRTTANLFDAFINGAPMDATAHELRVTAPLTAAAGSTFTVTVAAVDANGAPVTSYRGTVHFSSTDGATAVVLPADSTLTNGQVTFPVTLATAGTQTVTVSDAANSLSATAAVTVNAGAAEHLVIATAAQPMAGSGFSLAVTARDPFENIATSYTGRVHFTSSDGTATLPADATLTNGQGTFAATLTRAGSQTVTATDTATSILSGGVTVTVHAAAAVKLTLAGAPTSTAGIAFPFTVTAQDQFGNTDLAYAGKVRFTSSDTSATAVLPSDTILTGGQGTFSATLTKAGTQSISGTDLARPTVKGSFTIAVTAASAATLTLDSPASTSAGGSFTIKVALRDQYGNAATAYTGTIHFSTSDPLPTVVLPANYTFTPGDAGSRTFSARLWTVGNQTLTVSDTARPALTDTNSISVRLL